MKRIKIIYWVTTSMVAVMMLFSAYSYFTNDVMKNAFVHLGFPAYFRVELAVAKIAGALLLLLPFLKGSAKEFAYAGFAITFISAIIAHLSSGDPASAVIMPAVFLVILSVSFISFKKLQPLRVA